MSSRLTVSGEGDWGVLDESRFYLFPSRNQAMVFVGWLLRLGRQPELWELA